MIMPFDDEIFIRFDDTGMNFRAGESNELRFERLEEQKRARDLHDYVGFYLNPDLQLTFKVTVENKVLVARNLSSGKFQLNHVNGNLFQGEEWFFRSLEFQENTNGTIEGLRFYAPGTRGITFQKLKLNESLN